MRVVVVVDGEHYPPVVRDAIERLRREGNDVPAAVFCGGSEKLAGEDLVALWQVKLYRSADPVRGLADALGAESPDAVVDLSDEPVVTPSLRMRLASVAVHAGATYRGADFEFRPPTYADVVSKPSVRVIATGKRVGKTAVAGAFARHAASRGRWPVIVAMGRGGPEEPVVLEVGADLEPAALVRMADRGMHAASDYIEDAITARVPTIGCRRVAGGMAGATFDANVIAGARIAEDRDEDLVILEGSGAAVPPVAASAGLLCVPADRGTGVVEGYLNPYRVLLADVAVVTMAEAGTSAAEVEAAIHGIAPDVHVVRTVFRPHPLSPVTGRRVFFCTTAPEPAASMLGAYIQDAYGCEVVGVSSALADRGSLVEAIRTAPEHEVLMTEVKAAGIDVAARIGLDRGLDVVFADNLPVDPDGGTERVEGGFDRLLEAADERR